MEPNGGTYWFHMMARKTVSHKRGEKEQIKKKNGATEKNKAR